MITLDIKYLTTAGFDLINNEKTKMHNLNIPKDFVINMKHWYGSGTEKRKSVVTKNNHQSI